MATVTTVDRMTSPPTRALFTVKLCRYVTPERRSIVPEAVYDVAGGSRSHGRSVCCKRFSVAAAILSLVLNVAMSAAALVVLMSVTSSGSDVICSLVHSLMHCPANDNNCTERTTYSGTSDRLIQAVKKRCKKS